MVDACELSKMLLSESTVSDFWRRLLSDASCECFVDKQLWHQDDEKRCLSTTRVRDVGGYNRRQLWQYSYHHTTTTARWRRSTVIRALTHSKLARIPRLCTHFPQLRHVDPDFL